MNRPEDFSEALNQVVNQIKEVHPNIAVISSLSNLLQDPNTDMGDIAQVIKSEPSLTADIVKMSNSSYYGNYSECSDIESALARIGFNDVLKVMSLLMTRNLSSNELVYYDLSPHECWAQSVVVSFLMETLAKTARLNTAKAGTAGVLHNVGRVMVNNIMVMFGVTAEWDGCHPAAEWEESQVGFHYGEAGARFLKDMNFPEEIQDIIRNHVYPGEVSRANPLTQLLWYCVTLFHKLGKGFSNPDYQIPDLMSLQLPLEFSEEDIRETVTEALAHYQEMKHKVWIRGFMKTSG